MNGLSRKDRMKTKAVALVNPGHHTVSEWLVEYEAKVHDFVEKLIAPPASGTADQLGTVTIKALFVLALFGLALGLIAGPGYASVAPDHSYVPAKLVKDTRMLVAGAGGSGGSGGSTGSGRSGSSPTTPQSGVSGTPRDPGGTSGTRDPGGLKGLGSSAEPASPTERPSR